MTKIAITPFQFDNGFDILEVRTTIGSGGAPWFVLADVCKVLDLGNPSQVASRLDADEKYTLTTNEGLIDQGLSHNNPGTSLTIVNESGLWSVVLTSRKPEAKKFKKWLTSEVIPSIRKTGAYSLRPALQPVALPTPRELAVMLIVAIDRADAEKSRADKSESALDLITASEKSITATCAAKVLGVGPRALTAWLRTN
ncbi:MAG: BRO family protein, partial [Nitrospirales bacterium]